MTTDPRTYQYPDNVLKDRIVLITGATDGIGKALALQAAKLGAQVLLHGRNVSKLEKVYDALEAIPAAPRPSIAVLDLASANSESYISLASSVEQEFGRLDGLVHNAAIIGDRDRHGPFASVGDLERVPGIGPAKLAAIAELVTV